MRDERPAVVAGGEEGLDPSAGSSPEDIAWMVLRTRLSADPRGRDVLMQLVSAPERGGESLRDYLASGQPQSGEPTFTTVVTGGFVEKLVNIAQADVVNILPPRATVVPRQLPPDVADFTDRTAVIAQIVERAAAVGDADPPLICGVVGGGGIGKTALALHVAHRLAGRFADAHLYVDLRGADLRPADPRDVLETLLRALNVEGERIPSTTSERANLYRALLSGRRSIVVLDNAANAAQVRPLIPGSGSVVLVTSRDPLTELEGALRFGLRVLPPADAAALLGAIVGARRVAAEPEAARALAEACGHLPLALRIVAAKLATREHWRLGRMASRLADEGRRLSELEAGDLAVRASFASSYDGLDPALQRCFRLAALHPGPSFTAWALAALNDVDVEDAEELAERLVELNLLEFAGDDETAQPRYRFHDLVRLFAREQLQSQDSPTEQRAALERELGAYLTVSARGLYLLSPHSKRDPDPTLARRWPLPPDLVEELLTQPYAWFAAEHAGMVALVVRAHELQLWAQTYELAEKLHYYFRVGGHLADWQSTHRLALEAARAAGDRRAEAWTRRNLGNANQDEGRFAEAVTCFDEAARVFQDLGLVLGTAAALCNLGETYLVQGRFAAARDNLTRCLPYWRAAGDDVGVAYTLDNLALLRHYDDEPAAADDGFAESLALFRTLADTFGEAHCLRRRADLHTDLGRFTEAEAELRAAQEIFLRMGSPASVTWTSIGQARLMLRQGDPGAAVERAAEAVRAFQALDVRRPAAQGMVDLGAALDADGRGPEAESVLTQALTLLRDQEDDFGTARAHFELGRCAASRGDTDVAREFLRTAADAFAALPAALWTRRASNELAGIDPV